MTEPENPTALLDDPDYVGDVTISLSDEDLMELDEPEQDATRVVQQLQETGGVNRDMAVAIESMSPGIITDRVPLASFTRDYTRTNYQIALESAEVVAIMARVALAIGVATVAGMLAKWLYDTFFGESSGGGGGGADRDKSIREKCREARDGRRELEKAFREFKKHAGSLTSKEVKDIFGTDFIKFYNKRWEKAGGYNKLIDEMGKGQGDHLKFVQQVVAKAPVWMKQLEDMQVRLSGLVSTGKTDDIKIADYTIRMELMDMTPDTFNTAMPKLREAYKAKTVKNPDLTPALDENFEKVASIGAEIDKLKKEDVDKLNKFSEETKKWADGLKAAPDKAKAYNEAATQAQRVIRDYASRIGEMMGVLGMIQKAHQRIDHVLGEGTVKIVNDLEKAAKELEKSLSESEMEEVNGALAAVSRIFGPGTPFAKPKFKIKDGDKGKDKGKGDKATPNAKPEATA